MSYPRASLDSMKGNQMYKVYHLNHFVRSFRTRNAALDFVYSKSDHGDYEILDNSDGGC